MSGFPVNQDFGLVVVSTLTTQQPCRTSGAGMSLGEDREIGMGGPAWILTATEI